LTWFVLIQSIQTVLIILSKRQVAIIGKFVKIVVSYWNLVRLLNDLF
jgi:hypothetical protein